jgi:hypothetical protein
MIKDFWSIARFDYTILGIIATFSASANEASPLSLPTENSLQKHCFELT